MSNSEAVTAAREALLKTITRQAQHADPQGLHALAAAFALTIGATPGQLPVGNINVS